jgi:DNA-directed RNA polymerase specialized sigma24 family protein
VDFRSDIDWALIALLPDILTHSQALLVHYLHANLSYPDIAVLLGVAQSRVQSVLDVSRSDYSTAIQDALD